MSEDIFVRYLALPHAVRGLTVQDEEGNYNVYLNAYLSQEARATALDHELHHIRRQDFQNDKPVSDIERNQE